MTERLDLEARVIRLLKSARVGECENWRDVSAE
jgi:hypothetical protein